MCCPVRLVAVWGLAAGLLAPGAVRAAPAPAGNTDLAARVVVLANASDPDSLDLARYFAGRRGVPAANVIALSMSAGETIGWPEFIATIYPPLQDRAAPRQST